MARTAKEEVEGIIEINRGPSLHTQTGIKEETINIPRVAVVATDDL